MGWFSKSEPESEPKNDMDDDYQPEDYGPPVDEDGNPLIPDLFEPGVWHRQTNADGDRAEYPELWRGNR